MLAFRLLAMPTKFVFPVLALSIVAALGFGVLVLQEQHRVYRLTIATAGKQGQYYAFGDALAKTVSQHRADIQIQVLETAGAQENMQQLKEEDVQLALVQSDTPVEPPVRAIALLFPEVFHLIVRTDSGIQTVSDLQGKRLALMPEGSGSYTLFWQMIQQYSLDADDFDFVALPPDEAQAALLNGDADALFRVIALDNPSVRELLQNETVQLLSIDRAEALQLSFPFLETTIIPKGSYGGKTPIPPTDLAAPSVRAVLVTHEDIDSHIVYAITSILHEFRNEIVAKNPIAAHIRLPEAGENLGLPLHPGAKTYYNQDNPNFIIEYAEPLGLLLSVTILCLSGVWQFRLWLVGRQKNRADMYNLEILDLIDRIDHVTSMAELAKIRRQLFQILQQVVLDLDKDRISAESFQSFTFPWEVAIATIRHRETLLTNLQMKNEK